MRMQTHRKRASLRWHALNSVTLLTPLSRSANVAAVTILLVASLILGACSGDDDDDQPRLQCPRVAVLSDASRLTRFASETGRDLLDVDYQAEVTDLFAGCNLTENEAGESVVIIAVAPEILASRGPANKSQRADFTYFVSVVADKQTILSKETFPVSLFFDGNRSQVVYRDDNPPVTIDLPWTEAFPTKNYEILVGFQLTQADLNYNRETLGWEQ
jgi:hypothetical protein